MVIYGIGSACTALAPTIGVLAEIQVVSDDELQTEVAGLPPATRAEILEINAKSRLFGMSAALWATAAIIGLSFPLTFLLPEGRRSHRRA